IQESPGIWKEGFPSTVRPGEPNTPEAGAPLSCGIRKPILPILRPFPGSGRLRLCPGRKMKTYGNNIHRQRFLKGGTAAGVFYLFLAPKAQAVIIAVRGMDRMTPMLPATALMSSMEKKAELMS